MQLRLLEPVVTGNAGALARTAPQGAESFQAKPVSSSWFALRAQMRVRAPAFPVMRILPRQSASVSVYKGTAHHD
jgi:hypothetical protein